VLYVKHNYNDIGKEGSMAKECSTNGQKRNSYRMMWESQKERKRLQGKPRCMWVDNIKVYLREM
jgi:hypothetical protein